MAKHFTIPEPKVEENKQTVILIPKTNDFTIDLSYKKWLGSTSEFYKKHTFTNCLSHSEEFQSNILEILIEYFPIIYNDYEVIFDASKHYGHCHPVAEDKILFVEEITKEIHGDDVQSIDFQMLNENGFEWWYLGFKNNIRIVGFFYKQSNSFYPMFIDHHHLLHYSEHYNQEDYKNFDYCPVKSYVP